MITVAICTYNNERTLQRTLDSVLNQTYNKWEMIVIDANSNDTTREIIRTYTFKDPRIKYEFLNYQSKWVDSTVRALQTAKGQYFMFLDADDFISANYMIDLISVLENSKCIGSYGTLRLVDRYGNKVVNNPSTDRYFRFTNHNSKVVRISLALLMPESYGLVNFLYGLWPLTTLKSVNLWSKSETSPRFDQEFVLNILNFGKVLYVPNVSHFRTTMSKRARAKIGRARNIINNSKILKNCCAIFLFTGQILKTPPPFFLYTKWIFHHKSLFHPWYLFIVICRVILSSPVGSIQLLIIVAKKLYSTYRNFEERFTRSLA